MNTIMVAWWLRTMSMARVAAMSFRVEFGFRFPLSPCHDNGLACLHGNSRMRDEVKKLKWGRAGHALAELSLGKRTIRVQFHTVGNRWRKEMIMNQIHTPDPKGARDYFQRKISYSTGPVELGHALDAHEDLVVIDVRESEDYEKGHIPGSVNLPHSRWSFHEGLREGVPNVLLCYSAVCHLAAKAGAEFAKAGFPVLEMDGGFDAWKEHDLPIEKGTANRTTSLRQ